jgi:putative nucleotidyltransferase with HDIG domain
MSIGTIREKIKITEAKLDGIKNLPSLPKVIMEVADLLRKPNVTAVDLAESIGRDQGITTKILSIANSPLYGLQRQVSSLEFAIVVLGFNEINQLLTSISISNALRQKPNDYFKFEEFWNHSLVVGTGAKNISRELGFPELAADAFVGGMLHDMGIQLLINYFNKQFLEIVSQYKDSDQSSLEFEKEVLGVTHQEMGTYLARKWNLPANLCNSINNHHLPAEAEADKILVSIIHLTDYMCEYLGVLPFYWDKNLQLDKSVIKTLGFSSESQLFDFIENYREQFEDTEEYIDSL